MNTRNRRTRQPSNVFSMLTQSQITLLKEVFNMIDTPKDEKIDMNDINNFLPSIVNPEQIGEFENIEKNLNFYALLSLISDKFIGLNSKEQIKKLLINFSDNNRTIDKNEIMRYLVDEGFEKEDVEYIFGVFQDQENIEIDKVVNLLRHGEIDPNIRETS